jgi:MoxR-like ATPase
LEQDKLHANDSTVKTVATATAATATATAATDSALTALLFPASMRVSLATQECLRLLEFLVGYRLKVADDLSKHLEPVVDLVRRILVARLSMSLSTNYGENFALCSTA